MNRLFLQFLTTLAFACSVIAEEGDRSYSLKIMFQKAGEEVVSTLEFPNLDLEQTFQVTGPFPGVKGLVIECKPDVYDTPKIGFEVYSSEDSVVTAEGKTVTQIRIEAACPIVYGETTIVASTEEGTLSFLLDGPGPIKVEKRPVTQKKDEDATVPQEVIDSLVIDRINVQLSYVELYLYNPTGRRIMVTEIEVTKEEREFERKLAAKSSIDAQSTGDVHVKSRLPTEIGNSEVEVAITKAIYVD